MANVLLNVMNEHI